MGTRNRSLDSDARAAAAGRADHIEPFDESSVAEVLSALGGIRPADGAHLSRFVEDQSLRSGLTY